MFLLLSFKSSLNILDTTPLSDTEFANIFSHSVAYLFSFLILSFEKQTFLSLMSSNLLFFFCGLCFRWHSKKSLSNTRSWRLIPIFYYNCFIILAFTFRYLVHYELIFVMWYERGVQLHSFTYGDLVQGPFVDIWTLNSILLIYRATLILDPSNLDWYSFVINFKIRKYKSSNVFLPLQDCFVCSGSLTFLYEFKD